MKRLEQKIINAYKAGKTTLREVARLCNTNHHKVKRTLEKAGIKIIKGKKSISETHRKKISLACKGRKTWSKGKKMPKISLYKNMATHIRFNVSLEWLIQFDDIEKLKHLNRAITPRDIRFKVDTKWYQEYILKFYYDNQFNNIYFKWLSGGKKDKYLMPTIDHINPKAKNGDNQLSNLQFLTWFENRAKNDMSLDDWQEMKRNIKEYLI